MNQGISTCCIHNKLRYKVGSLCDSCRNPGPKVTLAVRPTISSNPNTETLILCGAMPAPIVPPLRTCLDVGATGISTVSSDLLVAALALTERRDSGYSAQIQ